MSKLSMPIDPRVFWGKKEIGLSLEHHDEDDSATSEPERLCVGVIMNDVGPIVVGEIVYMGKAPEGVRDPM